MTTAMTKFSVPSNDEMESIKTFVEIAAESGRYRKMMEVGGKSGILLTLLMAKEFDMKPLVALNGGLNNIDGRIEMSSGAMLTKIRDAGHSLSVSYVRDEHEGLMCVLNGRRKDNGDTSTITYSWLDAKVAGLDKRQTWQKYPKDMLLARATSRMARFLFPDVIGGIVYSEGEITEAMEVASYEDVKKPNRNHFQEKVNTLTVTKEPELSSDLFNTLSKIFIDHQDLDVKYSTSEILKEYVTECSKNANCAFDAMQNVMLQKRDKFEERFVMWLRDRFYKVLEEDVVEDDIISDEMAQ